MKEDFTEDCIELLNQIDAGWCENWDLVIEFFGQDIADKLDRLIIKSQEL